MNRLDGRPLAAVETDAESGSPLVFTLPGSASRLAVLRHLTYFREWIGVLNGEPERDVWRVETPRGICELHRLQHPTAPGSEPQWILHAWED